MMTWINFAMHVVRVFFFFFLSFNSSTSLIFALTRGDLWASNASVVSWLQIKHFAQGSSNKKSLGLLEHAVAFSLILHSKWLFKYSWSLPTIWPGSENKFKYLLKHFSLSLPSPFLVSSYKSPVWRRPIFVGEKKLRRDECWLREPDYPPGILLWSGHTLYNVEYFSCLLLPVAVRSQSISYGRFHVVSSNTFSFDVFPKESHQFKYQ